MGGVLALRPLLIFAQADMHRALDMMAAYLQAVEEQTVDELYIELVQ